MSDNKFIKNNNLNSNSSDLNIDYSSSDSERKSNSNKSLSEDINNLDVILNDIVYNESNSENNLSTQITKNEETIEIRLNNSYKSDENNLNINSLVKTKDSSSDISFTSDSQNEDNLDSTPIDIRLISSSENNTNITNTLNSSGNIINFISSSENKIKIDENLNTEFLKNIDTEELYNLESPSNINTKSSTLSNLESYHQTLSDEIISGKKNNSEENSLIIQLFDPYKKKGKVSIGTLTSDSEESDIIISSADNSLSEKYSVISNNTSSDTNSTSSSQNVNITSSDVVLSDSIRSIYDSEKGETRSIGINTEEFVMTLKIPFDSSKIIPVEKVQFHEVNNYTGEQNNFNKEEYEKRRSNELEELKKRLIKRNEVKMQKMFDRLLDKHNEEVEDEIFKSSMGINLDKITLDANTVKSQNNKKEKIQKNESNSNNSENNNLSSNSEKNLSDPYRMEYKFIDNNDNIPKFDADGKLIIPQLHDMDSDEKDNFQKNRKKEIMELTKKKDIINEEVETLSNISVDDSSTKEKTSTLSENVNSDNKKKNKKKKRSSDKGNESSDKESNNDDYEKRKKIRQERYAARKNKKTNAINKIFDMVYIISMQDNQDKIKPLIKYLDDNKIKYIISDGIDAKKYSYFKYVNRWRYQIGDSDIKLTKQLFDYDIYIKKNPDLLKGNIKNKSRAWHHWVTTGQYENRPLYEKSNIKNISQIGCLLAHNRVIIDAIKNNHNNILVLEDDIYFHKDFLNEFQNYMNAVPTNWNLLFFGATQKKWSNIKISKDKKCYIPDSYTNGAFAYGINKNLFETIKNTCFELVEPYDKCLHELFNVAPTYVLYPNIIISNIKESKIHRSRDIDKYSKIFKWNLNDYNLNLYESKNIEESSLEML